MVFGDGDNVKITLTPTFFQQSWMATEALLSYEKLQTYLRCRILGLGLPLRTEMAVLLARIMANGVRTIRHADLYINRKTCRVSFLGTANLYPLRPSKTLP